jgi:tripartite-type tricarboxylate transporter receptor subunit TctC
MARRLTTALLGALAITIAMPAARAAYPERPIRIIVPFPAGGAVDITARLLSVKLTEQLGKQIIIENKPGAGGVIGAEATVKAAPDGYTTLLTAPHHTITPALNPKLSFDTEKDLAPVSVVGAVPELFIASIDTPFNTFQEFVAHARANPGKLTYSSAGNGTLPHVTMELLLRRLNLDVLHIAYKGAAPAMQDMLASRVHVKLDTYTTSAPHIAAGKLKAFAYANLTRSPKMPDLPTIDELGVKGYEGVLWMGIVVPSATPQPIIATLASAIQTAVRDPALRERFAAEGIDPVGGTPEEFAALIKRELVQWRDLVRDAKITLD